MKTIKTTITKEISYTFDEHDIMKALKIAKMIPEETSHWGVYFDVPSGGDYSGMRLSIDEDTPIHVKFVEKTFE